MTAVLFTPAKKKKTGLRLRAAIMLVLLVALPAGFAGALEGRLNINTATVQELQNLPFVGPAKARAIVAHRRAHGPFRDFADLLASKTVGPSTLEAIKPYVTLSGSLEGGTGPSPDQAAAKVVRHITIRPGEVEMLPDNDYYEVLLHFIRQARSRIDITMFLFKTTRAAKNRPAMVVRELARAARRGVRVTVLLEKSGYDDKLNRENERVAKALRNNRVDVVFDSPDTTTHAKFVVIDSRYVLLGSHNLTHAALAYNHEFSLLIDNASLARGLSGYMRSIVAGGR